MTTAFVENLRMQGGKGSTGATGLETGSFAYIGAAAFSGAGNSEARFAGPRQIQVDADGDGSVDQAFLVDGVTAANLLTSSDSVWL